jgi:hypothetical protein
MITSLYEVPGLKGLSHSAQKYNVTFTCHGGLVRRLFFRGGVGRNNDDFDLFALSPLLADIDLVHSGPRSLTPALFRQIHLDVPSADCFRWELRSSEDNALYERAILHNAVVPANLLTLSSGGGIEDKWGARRDLESRTVSYRRNPHYFLSPLFRSGRDLEVFSVILHLRALLELSAAVNLPASEMLNEDDVGEVHDVCVASQTSVTLGHLQESASLRARLRYLLKGLQAATTHTSQLRVLLQKTGVQAFLTWLDAQFRFYPDGEPELTASFSQEVSTPVNAATLVSGRLNGDLFRLPSRTGPWVDSEAGTPLLREFFNNSHIAPTTEPDRLDDGQELLLTSPQLSLTAGRCESNRDKGYINEHIGFVYRAAQWQTTPLKRFSDENLSLLLGVSDGSERFLLSPPSACVSHPMDSTDRVLLFRVAVGDSLTTITTSAQRPLTLTIFVVGYQQ